MAFPILRTPLPETRRIKWYDCLAGYAVILLVMPALGGAAYEITRILFNDTGITRTAIGPTLAHGHKMLEALTYSFIMSWAGCLVSIPIVIAARWYGWFGWLTAAITGVVVMLIVMPFPQYRLSEMANMSEIIALPSACLGLGFWIAVRLLRPSAFAVAKEPGEDVRAFPP